MQMQIIFRIGQCSVTTRYRLFVSRPPEIEFPGAASLLLDVRHEG